MNMFKRTAKLIIIFITWLFLFYSHDLIALETADKWIELETRYTIIRYKSADTIERFHKSIHYGHGWWATTSSFTLLTDAENRKIATLKTDAIFERAQEILDMRKKFEKVNINLYIDKKKMGTAYAILYNQDCRFKAWYEYKTNTISLNIEDCHEGILAHELAHSIIDHFLQVRPPASTAEILARYVDSHLK